MSSGNLKKRASSFALGGQPKKQRDGYKQCSNCLERVGLRSTECPQCKSSFAKKQKNWDVIRRHASSMKDTYIKDKLFDRMDQLATKAGWTGILFLLHENPQSKSGQKRIFKHSYATRGVGESISAAMKGKVFNAMKAYLYGELNEEEDAEGVTAMEDEVINTSNAEQPIEQSFQIVSPAEPPPTLLQTSDTPPASLTTAPSSPYTNSSPSVKGSIELTLTTSCTYPPTSKAASKSTSTSTSSSTSSYTSNSISTSNSSSTSSTMSTSGSNSSTISSFPICTHTNLKSTSAPYSRPPTLLSTTFSANAISGSTVTPSIVSSLPSPTSPAFSSNTVTVSSVPYVSCLSSTSAPSTASLPSSFALSSTTLQLAPTIEFNGKKYNILHVLKK